MISKKAVFASLFSLIMTTFAVTGVAGQSKQLPTSLKLDGQSWQLGKSVNEEDKRLVAVYAIPPETDNNWTQQIMVQKLFGALPKDTPPAAFGEKAASVFKNSAIKYSYTVLSSNPQEAIAEIKMQVFPDPNNSILTFHYDQIQRIIRMPNNSVFILQYVVKKEDMGEAERGKWVKLLKSMDPAMFAKN